MCLKIGNTWKTQSKLIWGTYKKLLLWGNTTTDPTKKNISLIATVSFCVRGCFIHDKSTVLKAMAAKPREKNNSLILEATKKFSL